MLTMPTHKHRDRLMGRAAANTGETAQPLPQKITDVGQKRPRGRPRFRTNRWYALLGLMHCTAAELAKLDSEIKKARYERRLPPTARWITVEMAGKRPNTITNALTEAKRLGL
jgi:hypothetical protein